MDGAIPLLPICLYNIMLTEEQDMSLWCGTWLFTGTTLPLPLTGNIVLNMEHSEKAELEQTDILSNKWRPWDAVWMYLLHLA